MRRREYRDLMSDLNLHARTVEQAAEKMRSGDVRGARVRIAEALAVLVGIEAKYCNESGVLCDPGEENG